MLSNRAVLFYLMIIIVVVVVGFAEKMNCVPNKLILLSNCSFRYSHYHNYTSHLSKDKTTNDNRTLSMIVPYPLNSYEEKNSLVTILTHKKSSKTLIRFNLNMIQCSYKNRIFNWTSVESSSTLNGEFVRTNSIEKHLMYIPSGKTYLKNLTTIDCVTKTQYRTDSKQLFQLDLRIESILNDYCLNDNSCQPIEYYQCNQINNRCTCRKPYQSYLINQQYSVCLQVVRTIDQCQLDTFRCVEWCHQNSSLPTMCLCPKEVSTKKIISNNQAYCESQTNGICNSLIQCPLNDTCQHGICKNQNHLNKSYSFDIITISIIVSCLVLVLISIILVISIYILRRQRWKKHYQSPVNTICTTTIATQQQTIVPIPTINDYDNITYNVFRNNIQLSSSDDNDSSPMTTSDECSYEPKIVYLGGEEQLTAIFA